MQITAVTAHPVSIPLLTYEEGGIAPYRTSRSVVEEATSVVIRVETDVGIVGWGELNLVLNPETMKSVVEYDIGEKLVGSDPRMIRRHVEELAFDVSSQYFSAPSFISGVEIACWDILGKAVGEPVYRLLGGRVRDRVPISYCLGILDPERSASRAEEIVGQGFGTLKTKSGRDMDLDVRRMAALREGGGPELNIRVDPNQAYTAATAVEFLRRIERYNLQYIEQPLRVGSFGDLAQLRSRTRTPIAVNEDCYLEGNILQLVKRDAVDAAVVDCEPLGGLLRLVEFGGLARMANLPLAHHCGFDLGVKTAAILQGASTISQLELAMDSTYYAHRDDVLAKPLSIADGAFRVPEGPGLGVTVDPDQLERYKL